MNGFHLRLYTYESRKHGGVPVHDWLLDRARRLGIPGGSAFRAIAGFGRSGRLHEQHFFELAGEEPILVEFVASREQAQQLLELLAAEKLELFYAMLPTEYGVVGEAS
ncbi:MAG: DUF190 domain-containing protein [Pseudoxanthomonas sp.]